MQVDEIKEQLCYYDKRNPYCRADDEEIKENKIKINSGKHTCYCDNCFYGRTRLAEEILRLHEYYMIKKAT